MPIYAYKCNKCEHDFKIFHTISDTADSCPKCLHTEVTKQFPASSNIKTETNNSGAKQRIEKYIEETRQSIREQIEESRKEYNP